MRIYQIDQTRRLKVYAEGGIAQERYIDGPGWCLADDEDWTITLAQWDAMDYQARAVCLRVPVLVCEDDAPALLERVRRREATCNDGRNG